MKRKYISLIKSMLCATVVFLAACNKDNVDVSIPDPAMEGLLRIGVAVGSQSRLAELPDADEMAAEHFGLKNIGLYIYYQDDYDNGDLSKPYIRNMECTVEDGHLKPVTLPTENPENENIYIYDRMTLVAFYPYNENVEDFTTLADEKKYYIARSDYSEQLYIPYWAETNTDPTIAYYTALTFNPRQTYKIEIVVVADGEGPFPDLGEVEILPNVDPVENSPDEYTRELWYDNLVSESNGGGGSHILQYWAYIWTKDDHPNNIEKGEVLLKSGTLSIIASENVTVQEDNVYRYGYNMSTGEIFIPTATYLIHDIPTLQAVDGTRSNGYQVCDIDVSGAGNWGPLKKAGGRFDGGGHKITGLTINGNTPVAGLFGQVLGNSIVCNVNLIEPEIIVNAPADTCFVGAIAGKVNDLLSEADRNELLANLPDGLSPVVREELIKEMLADLLNSESKIAACRVENPTIVVNGLAPRVGTISGTSGARSGEADFKGAIWDCYNLGGSISVNQSDPDANKDAYVGGLVGLNNGYIARSYTTIVEIIAPGYEPGTDIDGNPVNVEVDIFNGYTNNGTLFTASDNFIYQGFSALEDSNPDVTLFSDGWPSGWVAYTGKWPIVTIGWLGGYTSRSFWYDMGTSGAVYPTLQWERR